MREVLIALLTFATVATLVLGSGLWALFKSQFHD
jgi:hypothetical protein